MKKNFVQTALITAVLMCFSINAQASPLQVKPVGRAVGIQIYTDGLLVIGMTAVNGEAAAADCGIRINDRIVGVNGIKSPSSEDMSRMVSEHPQGITLDIIRDNRPITVNAVPVLAEDNVYRLGLWVRDSCAGVGTITYYDPSSGKFGALGHAVNDVDTGDILSVKSGNILDCSIVSLTKSSRSSPGEINAVFGDDVLGSIDINCASGIFGSADPQMLGGEGLVDVAARQQVHEGDAYIITDALTGKEEKYSVRIEKVTDDADKSIVLEITDDRLIEASGGIVQGMSGSPIIQDGLLAGAVTHVFVNNPRKGYGTLAEKMLDEQRRT